MASTLEVAVKSLRHAGITLALVTAGFIGGALANPRDQLGKLTGANKHLEAAQLSLSEAGDDYGGHKSRATQLIGQAQSELKQAMTWANSH